MFDERRLTIRPTKDEPRCNELKGLSWPTPCPIALPSGAKAVISVFLPPRNLHCASCGQAVQL
jgi:hypothetical protein